MGLGLKIGFSTGDGGWGMGVEALIRKNTRVFCKIIDGEIYLLTQEFSSYVPVKFTKYLFTNIQKQ